uniref:Ig-like domain-containing protein n=1 Tax=Sinocyclocheilus anshuiensis TaxID=1608454 RepID=A0A671RTD1_9TELE
MRFIFTVLLVCQTTERLTDKRVNLGQNVTLDCQIDVKDIYWVFQKRTDSPVPILRTFTSDSTSSRLKDQSLKDKYSSLTLSRLLISTVTINELGIYYCVKTGSFLQLSDGIRLYITDVYKVANFIVIKRKSHSNKRHLCTSSEAKAAS